MPTTILIVDDEPDLREILSFNLTQAGYACLEASCGSEALSLARSQSVDLVLLDIMMPGMSGYEVAEQLQLPVIFLSALGQEPDKLRAFGLGADDYITKPFSIREVLARIEAVLRRTSLRKQNTPAGTSAPASTPYSAPAGTPSMVSSSAPAGTPAPAPQQGLLINEDLKVATLHGRPISLTKMEYQLLAYLLAHPHVVYSRAQILENVWPNDGLVLERTVDVTINRLRKKIGPLREQLKAKTGYGYYWDA